MRKLRYLPLLFLIAWPMRLYADEPGINIEADDVICSDGRVFEQLLYYTARGGWYLDVALIVVNKIARGTTISTHINLDSAEADCRVGGFKPLPSSIRQKKIRVEGVSYVITSGISEKGYIRYYSIDLRTLIELGIRKLQLMDVY